MRWIFDGPELKGQELVDWLRSDEPRGGVEWSRSAHRGIGAGYSQGSFFGKGWFGEIKEDMAGSHHASWNCQPAQWSIGPMPYYV
jgi:hypothetical protein